MPVKLVGMLFRVHPPGLTLRRARLALALGVAAWLSVAGAQACQEREIEIEQAGLGTVHATALDYEGETALLQEACFQSHGLDFDARQARAEGEEVQAQDVAIAGKGVTGRAQQADLMDGRATLSGLLLDVALPTVVLPGLPLPPGQYQLAADRAALLGVGRFRFGDARLLQTSTGAVYRLLEAELQGQRLTARRVELGRIDAQTVEARPNRIQATDVHVGLCRDERSRELELRSRTLLSTPEGTTLGGVQLALFGLQLPVAQTLDLPIRAVGPTVSESASSALAGAQQATAQVEQQYGGAAPQVVYGAGRFGARDLPTFDARGSRFNVVWHPRYLEFGVRTTVPGADVAFGIFQDPDSEPGGSEADTALPQLVVQHRPETGLQATLAFRGSNELTEARFGYAWGQTLALGAFPVSGRLLLELGNAAQQGVGDAFVHAQGTLRAQQQAGAFSLSEGAVLDGYRFLENSQLVAELGVQGAYTSGPLSLSVGQLERDVWGRAPLPDLRADPARLTTLAASLRPGLSAGPLEWRWLGYTFVYDWLSGAPTHSEASATVALHLGRAEVVPSVAYDQVTRRLSSATDVTLTSECFAYGAVVNTYHDPASSGVSLRLKFNFR